MRWRLIFTLFTKELTETLRDRRTLLLAIGLPVLIYPMMAIVLTKITDNQREAQEATRSRAAVWGEVPAVLRRALGETNRFELLSGMGLSEADQQALRDGKLPIIPTGSSAGSNAPASNRSVPVASEKPHPLLAAARELLLARKADAVLVVWPGFEASLREGGLSQAFVLYDSARDSSRKALERLTETLDSLRSDQVRERERSRRLPDGFSQAVSVHTVNVASQERRVGQMLGSMLPFLLILLSASGGLYAAIDLTAGEKERNTLQTLLCAPLSSLEIIAGKFLAAWLIVLLTTLANLASMAATFARLLQSFGGLHTPLSSYFLAFLVLLPATFMMTAVFLSIAVFARDFKDGQNLLTPMLLLLTLPVGATTLPNVELDAWTSFVPLVNIALLIKGVFLSEAKPELVFLVLLSSVLYAGLALMFAARVFQQEQILLGGRNSWRGLLNWTPERRPVPTAGFALTAFAVVFVVVFYASQLLHGASTVVMILVTQLGFFLLPNLLIGWRWGLSPRATYQLRRPPLLALVGAVLIGFSAWGVTAGIVTRLFPPPESFTKALENVLLFEGQNLSLWMVWLLLGVTPAVCEELFFRGLILAGFRRSGLWTALIVSSLLFAVAHSSIYRLLPTFVLGLIIGYATCRSRSMFTGITIHAINNSLLVTFLHQPDLARRWGFHEMKYVPWTLCLGTAALTALGLFLIRRAHGSGDDSSTEEG